MDYEWEITAQDYDIASKNGINPMTLRTRIRELGWGKQKALTTPTIVKRDYGKWPEIAAKNGISSRIFFVRVRQGGWSPERAATEPPYQNLRKGAKRVYPKHILDLANKNGICLSTFRARLRYGWTLEEACTKRVMTKSEAGKIGRRA